MWGNSVSVNEPTLLGRVIGFVGRAFPPFRPSQTPQKFKRSFFLVVADSLAGLLFWGNPVANEGSADASGACAAVIKLTGRNAGVEILRERHVRVSTELRMRAVLASRKGRWADLAAPRLRAR